MSFHVSVHSESNPGNEPSFLPGNLAGMQHAGLSVFVYFLALEPGIKKGKSQKPGKTKTKNTPPPISSSNAITNHTHLQLYFSKDLNALY